MSNLSINQNLEREETNELAVKQDGFLNSTIGKIINTAIDLGLRWVLPDFVENQVIDVKNSLIKGGLKEGIDKAIDGRNTAWKKRNRNIYRQI